MFSAHQIERAMSALGYQHGRPQDQHQRSRDFAKVQGGTNFMTPKRLAMYRLKAKPYVIVEISTGDPFLGTEMIGLTAVDCATRDKLHDDSKCINSLDELAGYFSALEKKFS